MVAYFLFSSRHIDIFQAWKAAVWNAKAQYEHQSNRAANLVVAERHLVDASIRHNKVLEGVCESLKARTDGVMKEINMVNAKRKHSQEAARAVLEKRQRRRDEAVFKSWQIKAHIVHMENQLGIPHSSHEEEEEEEEVNEKVEDRTNVNEDSNQPMHADDSVDEAVWKHLQKSSSDFIDYCFMDKIFKVRDEKVNDHSFVLSYLPTFSLSWSSLFLQK